jgi:hypothetical protein
MKRAGMAEGYIAVALGRVRWPARRSAIGGGRDEQHPRTSAHFTGLSCVSTACTHKSRLLGGLLPPSPPAEKATARQDQAGQSSTDDGAGDSS